VSGAEKMGSDNKISTTELSKHDNASDAWILINGVVWDVTEFAPEHPGGVDIISEYLGRDATKAYNEVHGPSLVSKHLDRSKNKGQLDESTITEEWKEKQAQNVEDEESPLSEGPPPLDAILNLYDFEDAAQKTLSKKSWAFYSGAANDSLTKEANIDCYRKIWFRPRVMVGVKDVNTASTIMGHKFDVPIFSSPAALAKLSHPDGELAMARALVKKGTTIIACNNASFSYPEIVDAVPEGYPTFYQLYVNKDRPVTEKLVREMAEQKPVAIIVTVDLPVVGKREADERLKIESSYKAGKSMQMQGVTGETRDKKGAGLARATGAFIDPDLKWEDISWLKKITNVPIFVKGIQCAADARKALEYGCAGIYISNHGGRAVDTAQPSILTLMEINANCPEVLEQMEVFIDGGIRRGTDILKAICLGASGVCLGRPFLYAVCYGQEGMEHAIDSEFLHVQWVAGRHADMTIVLQDELETAMQMCGITKLSQAHPGLLNTTELDPYVIRGDGHPYLKKIVKRQSKL
jgi:L-lactate dehydrogenase (cytochrome)